MAPMRLFGRTHLSSIGSLLRLGWTPILLGLMQSLMSPIQVGAQTAADPRNDTTPIVAGWIERISFPDQKLLFEAKLDSGADSSSINGRNVEMFHKAGRSFVKFDVVDDAGTNVHLEVPLVRQARIRRAGGKLDHRAVVRLKVCVGGKVADVDFTIANRVDLNYQVLIGRNMMAGRILVDSGRQRIVSDRCPATS
jgi:hypothetical protein